MAAASDGPAAMSADRAVVSGAPTAAPDRRPADRTPEEADRIPGEDAPCR
ncbi:MULTISPECIES: hypothetical protein [unclassified Streptomyces]